jgi:hypothetical protein
MSTDVLANGGVGVTSDAGWSRQSRMRSESIGHCVLK